MRSSRKSWGITSRRSRQDKTAGVGTARGAVGEGVKHEE